MAVSKAKRKRMHKVRNGKMDPALMRGSSPDFSTHTRKTSSKRDRIKKTERKHKGSLMDY